MQSIFHFAFNVTDLDKACDFYTNVLSCQQGRRSDTWVDYNFFGHQLSLHLGETFAVQNTGLVDGVAVPMPTLPPLKYESPSAVIATLVVPFLTSES